MARVQSFIRAGHTATADTKFRLTAADMWFRDVNIECSSNDAYYGDLNDQDLTVYADDVLNFQYVNLSELFFKNKTAGSNTVIKAAGTLLLPIELKELGLLEE